MNTFLRDLKGEKKKKTLLFIQAIFDRKKEQIVLAKKLVETYNIQLDVVRKVKNSDYPIKQLWGIKNDFDEKAL